MMKLAVINGPNLNLLGKRDKNHYGVLTLDEIEKGLKNEFSKYKIEFFQSNHEGEIIDRIQHAPEYFDAIIINPGGYSHTSVAIRDALAECKLPKIEVHLSNLAEREDFRKHSITAAVCNGYISGFRDNGYYAAIYLLEKIIAAK